MKSYKVSKCKCECEEHSLGVLVILSYLLCGCGSRRRWRLSISDYTAPPDVRIARWELDQLCLFYGGRFHCARVLVLDEVDRPHTWQGLLSRLSHGTPTRNWAPFVWIRHREPAWRLWSPAIE